MNSQHGTKTRNRFTLAAGLLVISLCVTLITLGATSVWSYNKQYAEEEAQMLTEARLLDKAVYSAWMFVEFSQPLINTDADGSYNFKGIYCSLVGKSVGKLFSRSTDFEYQLSYVRENPRNPADAPDAFEAVALETLDLQTSDEYYGVETQEDGSHQFRYMRALRLTNDCLSCHGMPAGEIDITGFEKEGLELGDISGAVSITMPMATREAAILNNTVSYIIFSVLIVSMIVAVFAFFSRRYVIVPLGKLKTATAEIGRGNLQVDLSHIAATSEVDGLVQHIEEMSQQLNDLYNNLEDKINNKTQQYQEANEKLSAQQQQIAKVNELLSEANAKLQEENKDRANFLSMVSHEMRTPLTAIITFTDLWEKSSDQDTLSSLDYTQKIRSYSLSLLQMINNTLDMAHIDAGKVELASEDVDFVDLVSEVEFIIEPLANAKGISFDFIVEGAVPLIRSDWDQIRNIILNLVSNAIKFTDKGGVVIVRIYLDDSGKNIVISVKDNGIGIEEDRLSTIFDRFVQVDSSMSRKYGGSGLGLALVREVAQMLGGEASVSSEPGVGSEFVVTLPFQENERYNI